MVIQDVCILVKRVKEIKSPVLDRFVLAIARNSSAVTGKIIQI